MTLRDRLTELREQSRQSLDEAEREAVDATIERLRMQQLAEHALAEGDYLPDFALPDPAGRVVTSEALLARGPLVLAFFRGGWCPYCGATMRALEAVRGEIAAAGGTLVGITPDRPELAAATAATTGLGFPLLTDEGGRLASLCGLQFEMSEAHAAIYRRRGLDFEALHAGTGWALPVPAMYVVRADGKVAYAFADPDYTSRAEPEALLKALRAATQAAVR